MTDDVTAISEETSAEAETVAAAAEEQTASLANVSHTATSLSDRARDLSDALSAFEVDAEPTAAIAIDAGGVEREWPADDEYTVDSSAVDSTGEELEGRAGDWPEPQ
ncbi:chemotaxis sensory transducer [Natrinema gari JCM 14663]|uniref:Chemotaxis sensory transducer n=1 Tax=Natrinema gari JCM 14663 TaxID=1230459 RepID=L9Z0G4_9EURY|nr:chemotaxis sensory transducer [Natrinema gari JCM 14663]